MCHNVRSVCRCWAYYLWSWLDAGPQMALSNVAMLSSQPVVMQTTALVTCRCFSSIDPILSSKSLCHGYWNKSEEEHMHASDMHWYMNLCVTICRLPTSNGKWTTGDGIKLALVIRTLLAPSNAWKSHAIIAFPQGLNASTVDMRNVQVCWPPCSLSIFGDCVCWRFPLLQVHPTGFVDLKNRDAQMKTLSAEVMRPDEQYSVNSIKKKIRFWS